MPNPAARGFVTPSITKQSPKPASSFVCPRCTRDSYHVVKELSVYAGDEVVAGYLTVDDTQGVFTVVGTELMKSSDAAKHNGVLLEWHLSVCAACSQGSVWRGDELIYPSRSRTPPPHEAMPEGAKQLYVEAAAVLPHSRRAAAALARAALERLLRTLPESSPEARLDDLIAMLSAVVSPTLWKLLTVVRYVGNDSLHGDGSSELVGLYLEGDAAELVEPVFGAINSIVEEVIVQPAEAERLYSMIPEGVRLNAEKKRDRTD